jgi:hypothetical protein
MADGNDDKKKNDANKFWDMLAEGMAKFDEGCRRINRRFAAVYAARTREFKGLEIDSIETHLAPGCLAEVADSKIGFATAAVCTCTGDSELRIKRKPGLGTSLAGLDVAPCLAEEYVDERGFCRSLLQIRALGP